MSKFNDYEKLRKFLLDRNLTVRVFEPSVNVNVQLEYFEFSSELKKEIHKDTDYLSQVNQLYDPTVSVEDKKRLLCSLASFDNIDYYHSLEQFEKMAPDELKEWATLALYESKILLEASLLDSSMVFVSTGLGAKNNSLRYFIALIAKHDKGFSVVQYDLVKKEIDFAFRKQGGEVEEVSHDGGFIKIVCLLPIEKHIGDFIQSIIHECNTFGDFIKDDFILSSSQRLTTEELENFLNSRNKNKP